MYIYIWVCVCMWVCVYVHMCMCVCVYIDVDMYMCMICASIYIDIFSRQNFRAKNPFVSLCYLSFIRSPNKRLITLNNSRPRSRNIQYEECRANQFLKLFEVKPQAL